MPILALVSMYHDKTHNFATIYLSVELGVVDHASTNIPQQNT